MSRVRTKNLTPAIRAPFWKNDPAHGYPANTANSVRCADDFAMDNGYEQRFSNAAGTDVIRGLSVSDRLYLAEEAVTPMYKTSTVYMHVGATDCLTQAIFVAPSACRVVGITEIHGSAESTAPVLTAYIERLTGTQAAGSGTSVMSGTFNMVATAQTLQTATLADDSDGPGLQLAAGDRLGLVYSTTADDLGQVLITISYAPAGNELWVPVVFTANGKMIDQHVFVADQDYILTGAYAVFGTKASVASKLMIKKTTGAAQAPTAGTALLTNNTDTGFDVAGTANTVQTGALVATAASLRLAPGNTLAFDFGTTTALAQLVVMLVLQPKERWKTVSMQIGPNASFFDMQFFTADRNYQIMAAAAIWTTAAAAGNAQITRDSGTTAGGAGTDLLSMDTNAGFQIDGTANTTEVATWKDARFNYLMAGDRLSIDFSATTTITGFTCTVALKPC